jgi:hypothetical protein
VEHWPRWPPSPTAVQPALPGPYRPIWAHVGRAEAPPPIDDSDQILGEAITFAALNDRTAAVDDLLDTGVPIDAAPYRGITSLHLAVQYAKPNMAEYLVECGASLEARDDE